jgi:hypothetical protein
MVTVYVWRSRDDAYGHASVKVSRGSPPGEVYMSWWPVDDGEDYCSPAHVDRTFAQDQADEGQYPDAVIEIDGLDETAMKRFWSDWQRDPNWCTLGRNCSTMAADALAAGGADEAVVFVDWFDSWNIVWTPENVESYAKAIRSGLSARRTARCLSSTSPMHWQRCF